MSRLRNAVSRLDFLIKAPAPVLIRAGLVAAAIGLFGVMFKTHFGIFLDLADTRCMPERVYLGYPRADKLQRGDVVSFRADSRMMFDLMTGKRIAKIVAAVEGDRVISNEEGVQINGVKVARRNEISVMKLEVQGRKPANLDRVLGRGEIFVLGTLPRSFDSRYWGVMPEARVDRMVKALF